MCLASVMLVVGANSVLAFTFCFIGEIPFPDIKCPKYLISILKSLHLDIFNLIPASQHFSKTKHIYVLGILLQFDLYFNTSSIQNTRTSSKYSKINLNIRFRKHWVPFELQRSFFPLASPIWKNKGFFLESGYFDI